MKLVILALMVGAIHALAIINSDSTSSASSDPDVVFGDSLAVNKTSQLSSSDIKCFKPEAVEHKTDVAGCRPSLTELRNYPNYNRRQQFLTGGAVPSPKQPHTPPYEIYARESNCAIRIRSLEIETSAWFSFKQARDLATEILQHCHDTADGLGGFSFIGETEAGRPVSPWSVTVSGEEKKVQIAR